MGERIDTATLSRWQADAPGNHTLDALLQLADASAFLDLPSEIVDRPPPDTTNIHQIIGRTIDYPGKVLPNLPNLMAMRNTTYFEDSPWQQEVDNAQSSDAHQNAHSMASSTFIVGMPYYWLRHHPLGRLAVMPCKPLLSPRATAPEIVMRLCFWFQDGLASQTPALSCPAVLRSPLHMSSPSSQTPPPAQTSKLWCPIWRKRPPQKRATARFT
jgi:hypothetical protein